MTEKLSVKQPLGPRQQALVDALRSGSYQQGQDWLHQEDRFCCLGVACDLNHLAQWKSAENTHPDVGVFRYDGSTGMLSVRVQGWYRFRDECGAPTTTDPSLLTQNDHGKSFADIASFIEAHPEELFEEPA